ncbi:acyl carrier protein [Symbiobacterium terraclitae]|uniref:Acyl carrier protein n=1 Tax=Symbiobacterium terraclitae TaxID=557451 RepID=A0ABS4JTQ9_9FIRM|nr:phosphopantetheine-binding protein [Symbiobacterium terraclitae]MBP2018920.1 acyl carrier protein [Symbiobacterium terraclitae]
MDSIELRIKKAIIDRLFLEISPEEIDSDAPLFKEGLGLDSIDALEVIIALTKEFGVTMTDEDMPALQSVNTIKQFLLSRVPELTTGGN